MLNEAPPSVSAITSDLSIMIAYSTGYAISVVTTMILLRIVFMRIARARESKLKEHVKKKWQPLMFDAMAGFIYTPFQLSKKEFVFFLRLLINYMETVKGQAASQLACLAQLAGAEPLLHQLARQKHSRLRLLAMHAAGLLSSRNMVPYLLLILNSKDSLSSLVAARSLLQICPSPAIRILTPLFVKRQDWPIDRILSIIDESDKMLFRKPLLRLAERIPNETNELVRLVQMLSTIPTQETARLINNIISREPDDKVISACLQHISSGDYRPLAMKYLNHPRWHVRVHAVTALGRIAVPGDETSMQRLLYDKEWWVRYRTAQTLVKLPFITNDFIQDLLTNAEDQFAGDILRHALAEKAFHVA